MPALNGNALCTLADVKAELALKLRNAEHNAKLKRYINVVSAAFERICMRTFARQAGFVESLPGSGTRTLMLSLRPIEAITSVVIDDGTPLAASEYEITDADAGFLFRLSETWKGRTAITRNITRDPIVGDIEHNIDVTYDGGFVVPANFPAAGAQVALPDDIQQAAIEWVSQMFRRRTRDPAVASEQLLSAGVSYFATLAGKTAPAFTLQVLDHYTDASKAMVGG